MNTYPCAELGAKHGYSCITATRTLLNGSDCNTHARTLVNGSDVTVHVRLSEDIDIDRRLGDTPTIP